jgi:hypothetical protein
VHPPKSSITLLLVTPGVKSPARLALHSNFVQGRFSHGIPSFKIEYALLYTKSSDYVNQYRFCWHDFLQA